MNNNNKENYALVGKETCERVLNENPDYKVFWRAGYAFRGATESVDNKDPHEQYVWEYNSLMLLTFSDRMELRYKWAAALDIEIDHNKKEIHINGFSENDLY